jgi:molecular chaperone DnaK (HSP70)
MPPVKRVISHRWQPDLIVGVDFGMTCTGVVYAKPDIYSGNVPEIKQIKRWPGARDVLEKVPTELIYSESDHDTVQYWGAECRRNTRGWQRSKRLFKLDIPSNTTKTKPPDGSDVKSRLASDSSTTLNEQHDGDSARRYFKDYISKLISWVDTTLEDQVPRYKSLNVEYTFTVPTSWCAEASTLTNILEILREAVGESQSRRARIGLTEAGAAASDSGRDQKKGDVVLIIDTGGGTTDINIFKFLSSEKEAARIKALTYDEGADIGSTRIDHCCLDYMRSRILETCGKDSSAWIKDAEKAVRDDFTLLKHGYGESSPPTSGFYLLPIGDPRDVSESGDKSSPYSDFEPPEGGYGQYSFKIPVAEMRKWFDDQISSILTLVDQQLSRLKQEHKREKISHIILSGGFALNKYYRSQLRSHFNERIRIKDNSISSEVEILNAQEPHLAVVRGAVYNRLREVMGMGSLYENVVSPLSFGFVVSEEYSRTRHGSLGEIPVTSALDGKQWIRGQIDWIIEEGVSIPSKGLKKEYDIMLHADEENVQQVFQIVSCDNPRKNLPRNINHKAIKPVCELKIDLSKLAIEKRRRKFSIGKAVKGKGREDLSSETREAKFDLWLLVGAADLRFEVKPRGEEDSLVSLEHDQIDIAWANPQDKENRSSGQGEAARSDVIVKKSFRQSLGVRTPSFTQ